MMLHPLSWRRSLARECSLGGRKVMLEGAGSCGDVAPSGGAASPTDRAPGPSEPPPLLPPAHPPPAPPLSGPVARNRNEIRYDVGPHGHILKHNSSQSVDAHCRSCGCAVNRKCKAFPRARVPRTKAQGRPMGLLIAFLSHRCSGDSDRHRSLLETLTHTIQTPPCSVPRRRAANMLRAAAANNESASLMPHGMRRASSQTWRKAELVTDAAGTVADAR